MKTPVTKALRIFLVEYAGMTALYLALIGLTDTLRGLSPNVLVYAVAVGSTMYLCHRKLRHMDRLIANVLFASVNTLLFLTLHALASSQPPQSGEILFHSVGFLGVGILASTVSYMWQQHRGAGLSASSR